MFGSEPVQFGNVRSFSCHLEPSMPPSSLSSDDDDALLPCLWPENGSQEDHRERLCMEERFRFEDPDEEVDELDAKDMRPHCGPTGIISTLAHPFRDFFFIDLQRVLVLHTHL